MIRHQFNNFDLGEYGPSRTRTIFQNLFNVLCAIKAIPQSQNSRASLDDRLLNSLLSQI